MVESVAAGRFPEDSLGGVASVMGVADPLESGDVTIVCVTTALVMGVAAASLEFTADMMGVAELTGDAADITTLLIGVMETLEFEVTLVVVVVTINNDAILVLAGMVGVAVVVEY